MKGKKVKRKDSRRRCMVEGVGVVLARGVEGWSLEGIGDVLCRGI